MLSHHEWKLVYTAVRKAQKQLNYEDLSYAGEYEEYHHILNKLYTLAYSEGYDQSTSIPGKQVSADVLQQKNPFDGFINPISGNRPLNEAELTRLYEGGFL